MRVVVAAAADAVVFAVWRFALHQRAAGAVELGAAAEAVADPAGDSAVARARRLERRGGRDDEQQDQEEAFSHASDQCTSGGWRVAMMPSGWGWSVDSNRRWAGADNAVRGAAGAAAPFSYSRRPRFVAGKRWDCGGRGGSRILSFPPLRRGARERDGGS